MLLAVIEPLEKEGYDRRIFECLTCYHTKLLAAFKRLYEVFHGRGVTKRMARSSTWLAASSNPSFMALRSLGSVLQTSRKTFVTIAWIANASPASSLARRNVASELKEALVPQILAVPHALIQPLA
jgi:hypothetical protein